jgi:hypothetical protein
MLLPSSVLEAHDSSKPSMTGASALPTIHHAASTAESMVTLKSFANTVSHSH